MKSNSYFFLNFKFNKMKTEINIIRMITVIILMLSPIIVFSQTNYLDNRVLVPYFRGTVVDYTTIDLDWDLSEINSNNKRLDIVIGVSQKDASPTLLNYANANWYYNQYNTNFNSENTNTRFVYNTYFSHGFTGLIFSRLDTTVKRNVVVSGENGGAVCL